MKILVYRLFLLLISGSILFYYAFPWNTYNIDVPFSWKDYRLGLDLQWWIELDYKVDLSEAKLEKDYNREKEREIIEWLKTIIDKRIESLNINDSVILSSDYAWEKHIIVQIPLKWNSFLEDKENIKKAKEAIWKVVRIKFKQIESNFLSDSGIQDNSDFNNSLTEDVWVPAKWKWSDWNLYELDEKYFVKSTVQFNSATREPMIELVFNEEWRLIFGDLSSRLVWERMAIFVWWELLTDPVVNEPILWWKAQVTWNYTVEEARELSNNINTWVVPAPIYLTSERSIDSKLGSNSLIELIVAWITWFILIFLFLIYTYRFSGLISSFALFTYVLIILAIVKASGIILTLASIAWLILSLGIAIDANILIFEKIREELKIWKNMQDATRIWFKKSWSAIWDSNLTGFIVAMILYIFWINIIKGFGLMLWIWIIVSLFSAMFISRVFVSILAKNIKDKTKFIWH